MSILSIKRNFNGDPNMVTIVSSDSLLAITAEGYLEIPSIFNDIFLLNNGTFQWASTDLVLIYYSSGIGIFTHDPSGKNFKQMLTNSGLRDWEPTPTFIVPGDLSVEYTTRTGHYTQIGNLFMLNATLAFNITYTTASGIFLIDNFPSPVTWSLGGSIERTSDGSGDITYPLGRTYLNAINFTGQSYGGIRSMGDGVPDLLLSSDDMPSSSTYIFKVNFYYLG